jgi:hypothetical protein
MQNKPRHYYRYQMTYPFESNKVYKSRSLNKVAKKCSNEFQKMNDINEGMFCITNLDKNKEYRFKIKNNKISQNEITQTEGVTSNQKGGVTELQTKIKEVVSLGDEGGYVDETGQILMEKIATHDTRVKQQLSNHDTLVKQVLGSIQKQIQTIPQQKRQVVQVLPKTESMEDLFEGIDPFDISLKRLYASQKMKNINNKNEDICIIL